MKLPSRRILLWLVPVILSLPWLARDGWREQAIWLAPVFLLLVTANLWLFLNRGWEDSLYPTDYASLYYPSDMPGVRRWMVEKDQVLQLKLVWDKSPQAWQVFIDGQGVQTIPAGALLRFKLPGPLFDGTTITQLSQVKHRCTLRPLPVGFGPDIEFTVFGLNTELYRRGGMQWRNDEAYLVYTDLPVGNFTRRPVNYWTDDYSYMPAESLVAADRVMREDMGVTEADDTLSRMEKITRHLRAKLANSGGIPKDDLRWVDPWRLWQEMTGGTGKGWCTQHAQLFTFFANRAGVPTRFVFGANTQKSLIIHTGHSWCESWVKEQGRWAFVDESQGLLCVQNRNGHLLNTADLLHLCAHEAFGGVTARICPRDGKITVFGQDWVVSDVVIEAEPGGFANVPFELVSALYRQEFGRQAIIKYRRPPNVEDTREVYSMLLKNWTFAWVNIDRYLFSPTPAYSLLPTDGARTYRVRQSLFIAMIATLLLFTGYFARG